MTKRILANHIDMHNKQYGTTWNYIIPCNLYGKYDFKDPKSDHFLTALIRKIIHAERHKEDSIEILGTGNPLRQFMYADDLARAIYEVIVNDYNESFNLCPPVNQSIRELAEESVKALGKDLSLRFNPKYPDGQLRKDISSAKFLNDFPNFKFTSFKDGIKETYEYAKTIL